MVKMGVSNDHVFEGGVIHFTFEGVAGGGGRVVGANIDWVKDKIEGSTFGGMMKCTAPSLRTN
jgi:hypothetical protein